MENVVLPAVPRRSSLTSASNETKFERSSSHINTYNPTADFGPNPRPHLGPVHSPSAPTSVPGAAHRSQDIPRNHSNTNRPSGMSSSTGSTLPARHHHHHHSSHHLPTSSASSQHPTGSSHHHHHPEPYPKAAPPTSTSNKGGVRGRVTVVCAECKRLKLRCSRDRPCTSCIKRACTDRCRYRNDDQPSSTPASSSSLPNASNVTSSVVQNGPGPNALSGGYHSALGAPNPSSHLPTASSAAAGNNAGFHPHPLAAAAQSALAAEHQHRLLAPPLQSMSTEPAYRIVSTDCIQCASTGHKCDRKEPCSSCIKMQRDGDCTYPGLPPLSQTHADVTIAQALGRLARLESRLSELTAPECDQCAEVGLKCDGRSPCSWCVRRSSASYDRGRHSPSEGANVLPLLRSASSCTYATYVEQSQRYGLHSPQPSLHANGAGGSRDRSPYAVRSPPPPSSSHSNASLSQLATGSAASSAAEVLTRLATSEDRLNSYARSHSHSFSHGHSLSAGGGASSTSFGHGHSLSHGSIGSLASASAQRERDRESGLRESGLGAPAGAGGLATTLTPITPSHPSSLHHYAVSSGASGSGPYHHHHSGSISSQHAPEISHQRSSSRHSPPQHHLLTPSYEYGSSPSYHHPPSAERERGDGPERDGPGHRPRQLSVSNLARPGTAGTPQTATASPGQYGSSPNQFGFGGRDERSQTNGRTSSYTHKMPTPPGSSSSTATAPASANQTKLPEISNILTLLSPAPSGESGGPNGSAKSPHAFPTPVSGVVSAGHSLLSLGGSSSIQHLQSDVRGSSHSATHQHRPTLSGSGFPSFIGSANGSRRGSADNGNTDNGSNNKQSDPMSPTMAVDVDVKEPLPTLSPPHSRSNSGIRPSNQPPPPSTVTSTTSTTQMVGDIKTQTPMQQTKHETIAEHDSRSEEEMEVDEIDNDSNP